jgi:hypothetical protein
VNEEAMTQWGLSRQKQQKTLFPEERLELAVEKNEFRRSKSKRVACFRF